MADGILGLPPGLRGWVAADQLQQQKAANQLQQLGGILNIQNAMEMKPLQTAMLQVQLAKARQNQAIVQGLLGGGGQTPAAAAPSFGEGGVSLPGGGQGNLNTGQVIPQQSGGQGAMGLDPKIMAMLASGDAGLMAIGKAALSAQQEASKPYRFNAGGGLATANGRIIISSPDATGRVTNYGPDGPTVSLAPGALDVKTALSGAPLPGAPAVKIPLSGGQTAELTQPEYLQWQQSGQLPPRYGQAPQPQPAQGQRPPAEQAALNQVIAADRAGQPASVTVPAPIPTGRVVGGLGVPGLTQSQEDVIRQKRQTAAGTSVDEAFGKDYPAFINGGVQDATKQLAQLKDVTAALQAPGANLTGPVIGSVPNSVLKFTNPQSIAMRERVEEVVQRSLRAILGAQFTEKEGERLIARAYNPNLSEAENSIRVQRLYTQLNQALENKKAAALYFQQNGTLEGWSGKLPSISDFDPTPQRRAGETGGWSIKPVP